MGVCLRVRVDGRFRKNSWQRLENESPSEHAKPEVDVKRDVDALVDRMALSPVGFAYPVAQVLLVLPDHPDALICAATVDDDVLEVRIALVEHRANGPLDERALVEGRCDDRDARHLRHVTTTAGR